MITWRAEMKLTIIAPTGGVGRQLLAQALDAHHDVTAVARNPAKLPPDVLATRDARVVTSDLADPDPQVLETAVAGADAVLSALGPHNNSGDGFIMRHLGVRIAKALFGKVYNDLARMEDVLRESGLDWTILRPPQLTGKPLTGTYRTAVGRNPHGGRSVSRADLAHCMLAVLDQPKTIGQVIGIAN